MAALPGRPRPARSTAVRRVVVAAAVTTTALFAVACGAGPTPEPSSSVSSASSAPSASPAATPDPSADPVLFPQGTAAENLPLFTRVIDSVWASSDRGAGRAYVDALAQAGFDKGAMQVTADQSTVGNPAETIQVSVLWNGECLIGQVGPATGDPFTVMVPELAEGGCLVGDTRPIDW